MVRLVISCLWICAVTLASAYATIAVKTRHAEAAARAEIDKVGYEKTRAINVPMIANGAVQGYVIAQFSYTSNADDKKPVTVPIEAFLLDEAFKTLYADDKFDFKHLEKYDIAALTKNLMDKVNARLNGPVVKDVLVEEFNYIAKEDISR
jgi:hypothetical protein